MQQGRDCEWQIKHQIPACCLLSPFCSLWSNFSLACTISPQQGEAPAHRQGLPQLWLSPRETDHPAPTPLTRLDWECKAGHCRTRELLDEIINQALSPLAELCNQTQRNPNGPHSTGMGQLAQGRPPMRNPTKYTRPFLPSPCSSMVPFPFSEANSFSAS